VGDDPERQTDARTSLRETNEICRVNEGGYALLRTAVKRCGLSAHAYHRVLRLARTIADLDGSDEIATLHVAEAIQYRSSQHIRLGKIRRDPRSSAQPSVSGDTEMP
jgi:magnesium chelatase family protein